MARERRAASSPARAEDVVVKSEECFHALAGFVEGVAYALGFEQKRLVLVEGAGAFRIRAFGVVEVLQESFEDFAKGLHVKASRVGHQPFSRGQCFWRNSSTGR